VSTDDTVPLYLSSFPTSSSSTSLASKRVMELKKMLVVNLEVYSLNCSCFSGPPF